MKIGVIGPIWFNIPPTGYGGTEEVVYNLVQGLSAHGHDVTLFGPKTAKISGSVIPTVEKPLREQGIGWDDQAHTRAHIEQAFAHAGEFDILHMHLNTLQDYYALELAEQSKTPVLFTIHFKLPTHDFYPERFAVLEQHKHLPFTSISDSQRHGSDLHFIKTVYNGIAVEKYPFSSHHMDYLVWLGRVHPNKGTKEAIMAARQAGKRLYVMGLVDQANPLMQEYYQKEVKPRIDGKEIIWMGQERFDEKMDILGGAAAFLNPILWEEPFGLVMTESQAVGTPVISFAHGAAPELIVDGKTGFLVNTLDEMVAAIKKVDSINRGACRRNIAEKFAIPLMISGYEEAYSLTISQWQWVSKNHPLTDE